VKREAEAVAAERVGQQDPRAGVEVAAVDAPDDVRVLEVPDLGRVTELEAVREQHGAHRAVGEDRGRGREQLAPAGLRALVGCRHRCTSRPWPISDHPRHPAVQPPGRQAALPVAADLPRCDQPRRLEHRDVLPCAGQRHAQRTGELADRGRSVSELGDDLPPCRVEQDRERPVDLSGILNHVVHCTTAERRSSTQRFDRSVVDP
jgi:hypothetical protein